MLKKLASFLFFVLLLTFSYYAQACLDFKQISTSRDEFYDEDFYQIDFSTFSNIKNNCKTIFELNKKPIVFLERNDNGILILSDERVVLSNMNFPDSELEVNISNLILRGNSSLSSLTIKRGDFQNQFNKDFVKFDGNLTIKKDFIVDEEEVEFDPKSSVKATRSLINGEKTLFIWGGLEGDEISLSGKKISLIDQKRPLSGKNFVKIYNYSYLEVSKIIHSVKLIQIIANPSDPEAIFLGGDAAFYTRGIFYHKANKYKDVSKYFVNGFYFLSLNQYLTSQAKIKTGSALIQANDAGSFGNSFQVNHGISIIGNSSLSFSGSIQLSSMGSFEGFTPTESDLKWLAYRSEGVSLDDLPREISDLGSSIDGVTIYAKKDVKLSGSIISPKTIVLATDKNGNVRNEGKIKQSRIEVYKGVPLVLRGSSISNIGTMTFFNGPIQFLSEKHPFLSTLYLSGTISSKDTLDTGSFRSVSTKNLDLDSRDLIIDTNERTNLDGKFKIEKLFQLVTTSELNVSGSLQVGTGNINTGEDYNQVGKAKFDHLELEVGKNLNIPREGALNVDKGRINVKENFNQQGKFGLGVGTVKAENYTQGKESETYIERVQMNIVEDVRLAGKNKIDELLILTAKRVYSDKHLIMESDGGEHLKVKIPFSDSLIVGGTYINARDVHFDGFNYFNNLQVVDAKKIDVNGVMKIGNTGLLMESDVIDINGALSSIGFIELHANAFKQKFSEDGTLIQVNTSGTVNVAGTISSQKDIGIYATNLNLGSKSGLNTKSDLKLIIDNNFFIEATSRSNVQGNLYVKKKDTSNNNFLKTIHVGAWTILDGAYSSSDVSKMFEESSVSGEGLKIVTTEPIVISNNINTHEKNLSYVCNKFSLESGKSIKAGKFQVVSAGDILMQSGSDIQALFDVDLRSLGGSIDLCEDTSVHAGRDIRISAAGNFIQEGTHDHRGTKFSSVTSSNGSISVEVGENYFNQGSELRAKNGTILVKAQGKVIVIPISWIETRQWKEKGTFVNKNHSEAVERNKRSVFEAQSTSISDGGNSESIIENADFGGTHTTNVHEKERALFYDHKVSKELSGVGKISVVAFKAGLSAAGSMIPVVGPIAGPFIASMVTDMLVADMLDQPMNSKFYQRSLVNASISAAASAAAQYGGDYICKSAGITSEAGRSVVTSTIYTATYDVGRAVDFKGGDMKFHMRGGDVAKDLLQAYACDSMGAYLNANNQGNRNLSFRQAFKNLAKAGTSNLSRQLMDDVDSKTRNERKSQGKKLFSSVDFRDALYIQMATDLGTQVGKDIARDSSKEVTKLWKAVEGLLNEEDPSKQAKHIENIHEAGKEFRESEAGKEAKEALTEYMSGNEEKEAALDEKKSVPQLKKPSLKYGNSQPETILINSGEEVSNLFHISFTGSNEDFLGSLTGYPYPLGSGKTYSLIPDTYKGMDLANEISLRTFEKLKNDFPDLILQLGQGAVMKLGRSLLLSAVPIIGPVLCFEGDTEVCLINGNHKKIAEIKKGDTVLSHYLESLDEIVCPVEFEPVVSEKALFEVVVSNSFTSGKTEFSDRILTTDNHLFLDADKNWVKAKDLEVGTRLIGLKGALYTVEKTGYTGDKAKVYDISVEGVHNFSVGKFGLIVHNCSAEFASSSKQAYDYFKNGLAEDGELLKATIDGKPLSGKQVDRLSSLLAGSIESAALNLVSATGAKVFKNHASTKQNHNSVGGFKGPAAKEINWDHVLKNHSSNGQVAQHRGRIDQVFQGMSDTQIKKHVSEAWKTRKNVGSQTGPDGISRIQYIGTDVANGKKVEFWFNTSTKTVETAYPAKR